MSGCDVVERNIFCLFLSPHVSFLNVMYFTSQQLRIDRKIGSGGPYAPMLTMYSMRSNSCSCEDCKCVYMIFVVN